MKVKISKIINKPISGGGIIDLNRSQIEHRALWIAKIYEEMVLSGTDTEGILRRAVRKTGNIHGEFFKIATNNSGVPGDFRKVIYNGVAAKTFDMSDIVASENQLAVEFHYCPLVNAWQKIDLSDEVIGLLCDITMEGDRGIADAMGYKLELKDTIANGCPVCKMRFHLE
jgi:hypothetical protein